MTTIERSSSGAPTAIVAPGGQTTTLTVNGDGELAQVEDPDHDVYSAGYDSAGQLTSFTDPNRASSSMSYDAGGLLTSDTDEAGATTRLSGSTSADGANVVTVNLPDGRYRQLQRRAGRRGLQRAHLHRPDRGQDDARHELER